MTFTVLSDSDKIESTVDSTINKLNGIQSTFKNCVLIVIGSIDDQYWMQVLFTLNAGSIRPFFTLSSSAAFTLICDHLTHMSSKLKKDQQRKYFQQVTG